ncbi:hypothetical protein BGLT_05224 [Caballeronia glathei]|uniref:Uncharacterized protein n=1 Tax=Caballeronia glathei TaxID=60547 RepID=A0A069PEZ5_9BURK|nr:hypothetical protein [Caballeronia glathei]KDR39223.1 hypothetical protein BG61_34420 [Caballeronia glathei]CDY76151.1 hypothetical protein BGLT_05224 [Caballeronia glathei]
MTERNKLICAARGCDGCNVCNDRADVAAERERFETWARDEGLISESHGVRFVNSMCDVARKAWDARAAISSDAPDGGKDSELRGIERAYQAAKDAGKEPGWANHYANALQAIRALIQGMK